MGGGARGCGEQVEEACHQTQDWARCCPLRLPVVRGGCLTVLLREAAESGESSAGLSVSPLFSSSPLPFSSSFLFSPSPFYSLILLGVPSCGPVGGFFFHHGFGAVAGAGCGGLVWARSQRRALSLVATVAAAEAAAGEAARRRQATELVGDLGSFLLLGSTFLSTARHCLHYFS